MPRMTIDTDDATELTELLQFLIDWIDTDESVLAGSFGRFVGNPAYHIQQLRHDINRHIFLLGGNDGEELFQPDQF